MMRPLARLFAAIGAPAAFMLAGCAATGSDARSAPAAAEPAESLAVTLARADAAAEAGDRDRLAQAVREIAAAGARSLQDAEDDPLPVWTAQAGVALPPTRGSALGPGYRRGRLAVGQSARIEQLFLSGEKATIALSTPDGGTLALRVRDARSGEVCDREGTPNHCQWVPLFTQRYSIEIVNRGGAPTRYYLVVE